MSDGQKVIVVHERLRSAILLGEIPPGFSASQLVLRRKLGVGRTPLRHALRMLQDEGLVVPHPNRQVRIADVSPSDVEALYVMRISLETIAARITVPTLTDESCAELEGLMAVIDALADSRSPQLEPTHRAFHRLFVAGAGARLAALMAELFDHSERYRRVCGLSVLGPWNQRRQGHRQMVDMAKARDADGTANAIAAHYARAAKLIVGTLDEGHELTRLRAALATVAPGALGELDYARR
jgi:DNA-binding GntR family transcriptional regulator